MKKDWVAMLMGAVSVGGDDNVEDVTDGTGEVCCPADEVIVLGMTISWMEVGQGPASHQRCSLVGQV